jgi:hypothetical protein
MPRAPSRHPKSVRPKLAVLVALAVFGFPARAAGAGSGVLLGEVRGSERTSSFVPELRRVLGQELGRVAIDDSRERYVLSANLLDLDANNRDGAVRATATVSLVLRRSKDQVLHAILSGRATAAESGSDLDSARGTALRAAVESALRRLPEAVRR